MATYFLARARSAALVAGIVQLSAIQQGPAAVGIIAAAALVVVILLRTSIASSTAQFLQVSS